MQKRQPYSRAQLVLELEPQPRHHRALVDHGTKGLIEALADLLLEALTMDETPVTIQGGVNERQDNA